MSTLVLDAPAAPAEPAGASNHFAALLRWLGAATVASATLVFLLQGLADVEGMLRNWGCLVLMALLSVAGVGTRAVTGDARSVRVLLGLATALLPIQCAQLGGMLHALLSQETTALTAFFAYDQVTAGAFAAVAAGTLLAWLPVAHLGFSVLVRPDARLLTALSLLPSALLLMPVRTGVPGFALLAALAVLTLVVDRRLRARGARYRTPEGRAVRAMLAVPLLIAAGRHAFHVDSLAGGCALVGLAGLALAVAGRRQVRAGLLKEATTLTGALLALTAWLVWCVEGLVGVGLLWMALPAVAFLFAIGRGAALGPLYRALACGLVALSGIDLLDEGTLSASALAAGLGLATAGRGFHCRERGSVMTGVLLTFAAGVALVGDVVGAFRLASWVVLALGGVALVVLAAFVERYGHTLPARLRTAWAALGAAPGSAGE